MRMRQEQIVFLASAALLGALGYGLLTSSAAVKRTSDSTASAAERKRYPAPDVSVVVPNQATPVLTRELFLPPRDSSPLPPLELVEPPRERLVVLLPPTLPGPLPAAYGKLLRRPLNEVELPDLFAEPEGAEGEVEDDEFFELSGKEPATGPGAPKPKPGAEDQDEGLDLLLSPAERAELVAEYKRRYDWVQRGPGDLWFGRIVNPDRYGLEVDPARAEEALQFVRLNPKTGREFFGNISAPPLSVARADLASFGFAQTVANEIELGAARIGTTLSRGSYPQALQLARHCIEKRLEAPRALVIGEELYRRATAFDPKDPEPQLGLARCLEAAFQFEEAFRTYQALLVAFAHREEVHVALAGLEERFLLLSQAEARLRGALAMNQGSWVSRHALGSFLVRRGRAAEALEHLKVASQAAPQAPELLSVRVAIRNALGDAHLALGELAEAEAAYRSAIAAEAANVHAQAGVLATMVLAGKAPPAAEQAAGADFELLYVRGVAALAAGEHASARDLLRLAAEADPFRAHHALAALSVLAEVTGHAEEALRLADEALERDPTHAFALFQKGRLLGLQDDYEGARTALLGALEQDLDFVDALVALGDVAFRLGRFEDAEQYLLRAVTVDTARPEVHALRGINLLRLGSLAPARAAFERALELARNEPTATAGIAWCFYLEGDATEALARMAQIEDQRRNAAEDDPWRRWSRTEIKRLQEHLQKVEWRDPFARKRLANGWATEESDGVVASMVDGAVELSGQFDKQEGRARIYRKFDTSSFLSFKADVFIESADGHIGIFAARERASQRTGTEVIAEAAVLRHPEGNVQLRFVRTGQARDERDMQQPFPTGKWVRLELERRGESSEASVQLSLDGIPLIESLSMPPLGQAKTELIVGLFAEGLPGRKVVVRMDNVAIVTR
jgi:tetratricopeptide (TPR) repeat protein